jgi:hypothetical protein
MNDDTTARYLSEHLGKRVLWRKMRGPQGYEWELAGAANLRDALELRKGVSRESSKVVVFTESGDTYLLGRAAYDQVFKRDQYSPDPFEPQRPSFSETIEALIARIDAALERRRTAKTGAGSPRPEPEPQPGSEPAPERQPEEQDR